ncbi:uncharacterized protein M6B38_288010 [Iris pallida]|uniref:Uncharacterized protein n=1 Tax=Iris pallida TaxID=29817 RepID=A0AAX6HWQ8_IRIPA|nr:uncharacterized protein M6B38_288010 [Iris pallida]
MGSVCFRGMVKDEEEEKGERVLPPQYQYESSNSFSGIHRSGLHIYDSGELRMTPARNGKVSEAGSIFGRAGIAGLEKAVSVLDTLGSSMSNLNHNSGFISGVAARGNNVSILAFEVANTIAKGSNLLRSLSDENIKFLKEEVLQSDGLRKLVSVDTRELMSIAAIGKREEFDIFSAEVIRFGDMCKDPVWHNLNRYFQKLDFEIVPLEQLKEEVETTSQHLINLAQNTSELYHELHALDRFEQDYQRKLQEEDSLHSSRRETLMILHSELKRQRKLVKTLKKNSLWSRTLEEVVEKLVDVVVFLHKVILEAFGTTGINMGDSGPVNNKTLGVCGLALHYANIINQIDNIVSRPLSLPPNTRDTLYHGLPTGVKIALRARLQSFDTKEEYTVSQIKTEMERTLSWIVPLAENTIRAHQGFGWVGEWAKMSAETNKKQAQQISITRLQTLHHADKEKAEECILQLVVWLHHFVIQVKNRGLGFKALKPGRSRSQKAMLLMQEMKQHPSLTKNGKCGTFLELSEEDRQLLEHVGSKKMVLGRSKSHESATTRGNRFLSRSCGNSPSRESIMALDMHLERTKVLDVIDGLDIFN